MSLVHLERVRAETGWKSPSRISGEACERYVWTDFACPRCQGPFVRCPPNTPFQDMSCARCAQRFQIKATRHEQVPDELLGGAYHTTRNHLSGLDFLVVLYPKGKVYYMPHERIRPSMVRPRKALTQGARRAGWRGCTLRFDRGRYICLAPEDFVRWGRTCPRSRRRIPRKGTRSRRSHRRTNGTRLCPLCTTGT
jgi:type II restriction enzyme